MNCHTQVFWQLAVDGNDVAEHGLLGRSLCFFVPRDRHNALEYPVIDTHSHHPFAPVLQCLLGEVHQLVAQGCWCLFVAAEENVDAVSRFSTGTLLSSRPSSSSPEHGDLSIISWTRTCPIRIRGVLAIREQQLSHLFFFSFYSTFVQIQLVGKLP